MGLAGPSQGQTLSDWVTEKATSSAAGGGSPTPSAGSETALTNLTHNLVFSSTDADTVSWASGIIMLSDGRSYSIGAGNTGTMAALTYIYLDLVASETTLQTTTTYSTAVGDGKYLIAVAQNATTAASYIIVAGTGGFGGELIVNANMISNLLITASQIANATITSGKTVIALRNISHNLVFSSTDEDTVAWASGTITLSDGTAYSISGGNTGTMAARTYIYLDPSVSSTVLQTTTTAATASADGKYLIASAINVADADKLATFSVFNGAGGVGGLLITSADQIADLVITAAVIANLTITAAQIANATITSGKTKIALHGISHDLVFSASDVNTVAWASGTITGSDGTNYSITGSNTGNISALTYIYLDTGVSTTALQTSTTYSAAVGDNKILIAVAEDAADSGSLAFFHVFGGIGGLSVNAEHIANLSITAALISNLTIVAGKIANATINSGKMDIDNTSWGANLISNGSVESWSGGTGVAPDKWTLTGSGASVAQNTSDVKGEGQYSCNVTNGASNAADLGNSLSVSSTVNAHLRGATVSASVQVKVSTASRVTIKVDDGVDTTSSSAHTGGGTYEQLTVTHTMNASATKLELSVEISSGGAITATFDNAMLTISEAPTNFALNLLDKVLAVSNYQNATPTNFGDQGIWRAEIGQTQLVGDTGSPTVNKTVTFATAFRTVRVVVINGEQVVGGDSVYWFHASLTTSNFVLYAGTIDGGNYANTNTGNGFWIAVGQVVLLLSIFPFAKLVQMGGVLCHVSGIFGVG